MSTVIYENENATFNFGLEDVVEILNRPENKTEERDELLDFLLSSSDDPIKIPEKYNYFAFTLLDLTGDGKGAVFCKRCNKTYQPDQLKSLTVGHGKTPFSVNIEMKGGIKNLFRKRPKLPGMLGGKGYECSEGHKLIALITWRT